MGKGERMGNKNTRQGGSMASELRLLIVETIAEMKELKGEMKEFKDHVIGRVLRLEKKESERAKERVTIISIIISATALAVSIIVNFLRGGK
jgi:hypothetical protein